MHTNKYARMHACIHMYYIDEYIYTQTVEDEVFAIIDMPMHTYIHTYMHTHIHTYILRLWTMSSML
jgi:hypothetical protein